MKLVKLSDELKSTSYPGRGIVIGRSSDGSKAVTAYFIMGRSVNSRNRVFVEDGEGLRTQAFDEEAFRAFGVEPADYHIIVVKSAIHYRAAWRRWVKNLVTVDMPNITSFDERKINFPQMT